MTETKLENQDFIAPVVKIVTKETKKAVDVEWEREFQRRTLVKASDSTIARSALLSSGPPLNSSAEQTIKKVYFTLSWPQAPNYRH